MLPEPTLPGGPLLVHTRFSWGGAAFTAVLDGFLLLALAGVTAAVSTVVEGGAGGIPSGLFFLACAYVSVFELMVLFRRRPGRVLLRLDADGITAASLWPGSGPPRALAWSEVGGCCLYTTGTRGVGLGRLHLAFYPAAALEPPPRRRELAVGRRTGVAPIAVRYSVQVTSWNVSPDDLVQYARWFRPGLPVADLRRFA